MNKIRKFTASLHTHVRSLHDAYIDAKSLCNRIKELGGEGIAITDHGVLTSIEDYRTVFKENGLKLIPGCEIYVDGGILGVLHLIILAVNDHGYKGVCKIVTDANYTLKGEKPVISRDRLFEIMKNYKGDIIALSACMQGVLCTIFLTNYAVESKIRKAMAKRDKYLSPHCQELSVANQEKLAAEHSLQEAIRLRDETKKKAEMRFAKRENALKKLEETNDANYITVKEELEADKKASETAKRFLPKAKSSVDTARKTLSAATNRLKEIEENIEKYLTFENQIVELKSKLKNEGEMYEEAKKVALSYVDAFGADCFYAEMQYHGIEEEKICFPKVAKLARDLSIPLVATNDVHILNKTEDERLRRQILRSIRFGKAFEEENVGDEELYLKDDDELSAALSEILSEDEVKEAIQNISAIFSRCNVSFETSKHYPVFPIEGMTSEEYFDQKIKEGVLKKIPNGLTKEEQARLDYEMDIIKSMGYVDYHLIEMDILAYGRLLSKVPKQFIKDAPLTIEELKRWIAEMNWENNPGERIGPGRGSAVGSFVCFILDITALNPMKYGLLFERFLNPERISMPDIDSDISADSRAKVIEYVTAKFGYNAVCGIMTTTMQAPKGAIDIAAKYYGLKVYGQGLTPLGRSIAKDVPEDVGTTFTSKVNPCTGAISKDEEDSITLYEYLLKKYQYEKDALHILHWASVVEGSFTAYGAHAAGIVIMEKGGDISEHMPLRMNTTLGMMTTQCDMVQTEENGFLKFDFLGLKTLDIITETVQMILKNHGIFIDVERIDLEDKKVFDTILQNGKTNSVFQFESAGMKNMLKKFKPTCFEDLIILVSMFRPGPLQYLDDVIAVKNGSKEPEYLCSELKPILGKTYAAIVYQEQVMEIFQKLAGYTLGGADMVRRYMSKKKSEKLAKEREAFVLGDESRKIAGCVANGIKAEVANKLFDQMESFAKYAFNKSHAAAYAFIAYITAWLKCYYPVEFFAAALNWTDNKKLSGLMYEAASCGVKVYAPDINLSEKEFIGTNGSIRFALSSVTGVKSHADTIIAERKNGEFLSFKDFLIRVKVNKTVVSNLISAGAFDSFSSNRASLKQMAEDMESLLSVRKEKKSFIESAEYVLPLIETLKSDDELISLQERNGFKREIDKLTTADKLQKRISNAKTTLAQVEKDLNSILFQNIKEDKTNRMKEEKEYLGMYVTQHPMDFYPNPEDVNASCIADTTEGDICLYGIISSIQFKNRKRDGAKMAFFTLEDRSGSMDVALFTKNYGVNEKFLEEGNVVRIMGECKAKEDGNEEELQFIAQRMSLVSEKRSTFLMSVSSMASFHLDVEDIFKKEYVVKNGHPLIIYDEAMDEMREMKYAVKESALTLPNVKEIF